MSTTKNIQVNRNGHEHILFRIDVYFPEYLLVVKIAEKGHTDRDLIFEEKRQEALEKKIYCKFIRINTSKRYDEDYEIGRIQTFISKFKNRKLRKLEKKSNQKNKRIRRRNKKIKTPIDKLNHSVKEVVKKTLATL